MFQGPMIFRMKWIIGFDFKFRDLLTNDRDSEFGEIIDDGTGFRMFLKMTETYMTLI